MILFLLISCYASQSLNSDQLLNKYRSNTLILMGFEVNLGLKLLDKVIELLRERGKVTESKLKKRKELFHEFIEPMYADMEVIQKNYYSILFTIQKHLADENIDLNSTIEELKQQRKEMEPLRVKTRAVSRQFHESLESNIISIDDKADAALIEFVHGIGRIMGASACAGFRASEIAPSHIFFDVSVTYDLLFTLEGTSSSRSGEVLYDETILRKEGIENVGKIIDQLTIGWGDVAENYATLKTMLLFR